MHIETDVQITNETPTSSALPIDLNIPQQLIFAPESTEQHG
jgi:hypothetical protein